MENAELIKALRCKEYFDLCKDASCKYHVNGMRSGCRCEIKVKEHAAADALEAAEKRVKELESAQRWIPVTERLPEQPPDFVGKDGKLYFVSSGDFLVADAESNVYVAHYTFGCSSMNYFDNIEILGNVYENPELLEDKK